MNDDLDQDMSITDIQSEIYVLEEKNKELRLNFELDQK